MIVKTSPKILCELYRGAAHYLLLHEGVPGDVGRKPEVWAPEPHHHARHFNLIWNTKKLNLSPWYGVCEILLALHNDMHYTCHIQKPSSFNHLLATSSLFYFCCKSRFPLLSFSFRFVKASGHQACRWGSGRWWWRPAAAPPWCLVGRAGPGRGGSCTPPQGSTWWQHF